MKILKIIIFIIASVCLLAAGNINAQIPYYYYYNGEKQYLNLDKSRVFVSVVDTARLDTSSKLKNSGFKQDMQDNKKVKKGYTKRYWKKAGYG